jgi:L-ribulose-5-phosphate 3-epimerase
MKRFPIGVMQDSFRLPFDESLEVATKIGADGLQISAYGPLFSPMDLSVTARSEALAKIKAKGLSVSAICGDLGGHGFSIAEDNPARIEKSKRIMDLALQMETHVVTTHIGVIPSEHNEKYEVMAKACRELGEYGESVGAVFAIETGPETPEVLNDFLNDIGTKGIGVNYDPANLVMVTGSDPIAGVHTLTGKIVHTHAKDGIMKQQTDPAIIYNFFAEGGIHDLRMEDYFAELPLGQGHVDLPAWVKALEQIGYTGFLTIEREVGADPVSDIEMAVSYLKQLTEVR